MAQLGIVGIIHRNKTIDRGAPGRQVAPLPLPRRGRPAPPIIAKNPWKLEQEAFIQTRIEDAKTTVPGTLISFKSDYNVTVYVAYDDRATTLPQWLWTFKPYTAVPPKGKAVGFIQNLKLMASDRDAIWRRLLVKDFSSAETIALGSNLPEVTTATLKMYNVIVQPKPMPKKK